MLSIHTIVSGKAINALHHARLTSMKSIKQKSTLTEQDFNKAVTGFVRNIQLKEEDFVCPKCGPTPDYIVADAKICSIKCDIEELTCKEGDTQVLSRGSKFKDRIFLDRKKERDLLLD